MRDPSIVRDDNGVFHLVWTSGWWDNGIGYASSKDLIHWSEQKYIPVMEKFAGVKNTWAPELFYDKKEKLFYIFWASTVPGALPEIPTSESEKGLNHKLYYVQFTHGVTSSHPVSKSINDLTSSHPVSKSINDLTSSHPVSKSIIGETKMFYNPGFSVIDGAVLEKDGRYYLFVKNENSNPPEKNIRVVSNNKPFHFSSKVSEPIKGNYWAEEPTPLQVGENVYVYFDKYREHKYGAVRSKDMRHWEDVSDSVSMPKGIRHGTAFIVRESEFNILKKE